MIDRYTKIVLTVIAIALSGIALRGFVAPATAQMGGCGDYMHPCYIDTAHNVNVNVTNWPVRY